MFKWLKNILPVITLVAILMLPCLALATDGPSQRLTTLAGESGYNTDVNDVDLPRSVGNIISIALGLLGIIFLALIVYSGFMWMIAAGNEDKVTTSKKTMLRATIGLVIVVASYAISQFVIYAITN